MNTNKQMWRMFLIGGLFGLLSQVVPGAAEVWFKGISMLAIVAGIVVSLVGRVAARRALEAEPNAGRN